MTLQKSNTIATQPLAKFVSGMAQSITEHLKLKTVANREPEYSNGGSLPPMMVYVTIDERKIMQTITIQMDGDHFQAIFQDFVDLMESPSGFGKTILEALEDLKSQDTCKRCDGVGKNLIEHTRFDPNGCKIKETFKESCEKCNGCGYYHQLIATNFTPIS